MLLHEGPRSESEEGCFVYLELKFVWAKSHIVLPRCVEDVKYALVMLFFTHTIDECVIRNTT